ncbi:MAG: SDR family NAD(P)-dependent oxidoreductase [Clostridiales bacterium]|nr:SDR family NAD(P)-dependent oxidoreductase [Clostridiales bacterium]
MLAVITGASSGLGKEFAIQLDKMGYETVLVARREDKLLEVKQELKNKCTPVALDLSKAENCHKLFNDFPDADILINNAGFGKFGAIKDSNADEDVQMININVTAQYLLQKLYLKRFMENKKGRILNTASAAAFMAGPYFALYYASKAFVLRASQAANREAKGTGVTVSAFCPGSVKTEFNSVAGTTSSSKPISSEFAVKYALKKMFKGKAIIIPTFKIKMAYVMAKLLPESILTEFSYKIQKKRM